MSTPLSFKTMQKSTTTVQLYGLHPTALWSQEVKLCRILVQALFPLKAGKLKDSSSSVSRTVWRKGELHDTEAKSRETFIFLWSFLQCLFIVVLGRCACIYLQLIPNTMPTRSLCILLHTRGEKQGITLTYPLPASSCAHPSGIHLHSLPSTVNLRCSSLCTSLSPHFLADFIDQHGFMYDCMYICWSILASLGREFWAYWMFGLICIFGGGRQV